MESNLHIPRPFDAHVHGRQGLILNKVAPMTAQQCWGAIFEPNLEVPVTTAEQGLAYRKEIQAACSDYPDFRPFVLVYLTDTLDPQSLYQAISDGVFIGAKFYPRGATTNSDSGIVDVRTLYTPGTQQFDLVRAIAAANGVIQLHCELNFELDLQRKLELDPYDKEAYFFREVMPRLLEAHPDVKFSCEHLTSSEGASFVKDHGGEYLGCSITPHHLLCDRRDMFRGGLRPHAFCLPVIKRHKHRLALLELISVGYKFVYAGTDSAPHDRKKKESDCCSGGIFTAHAAVELYAQAFEGIDALEWRFAEFMSVNGPRFYGLEPSEDTVELVHEPWTVDHVVRYWGDDTIRPFGYEEKESDRMVINWRLVA